MPAGLDVTVPVPGPLLVTVKVVAIDFTPPFARRTFRAKFGRANVFK